MVFWIFSERLLGPFWNFEHQLSVVFGFLIKSGVLVSTGHFVFLRELVFQMVDFTVVGFTIFLQGVENDFDIGIHLFHSISQSVLLWVG